MSLRDQLQAIYDTQGQLTPSLVLDAARDENHPLHDRFEWDDAVAGEAYRRQQAHELIRSVRVVYREDESGHQHTVRKWHALRTDHGHVYEPAEKIAADPFMNKLLMADMEREWKQLRGRYGEWVEFWEMVRGDAPAKAAA